MAEIIEIRIRRDDELAGEIADRAELSGYMYATNGREIRIVPKGTPGWWPVVRGERRVA